MRQPQQTALSLGYKAHAVQFYRRTINSGTIRLGHDVDGYVPKAFLHPKEDCRNALVIDNGWAERKCLDATERQQNNKKPPSLVIIHIQTSTR
ncbi:hypothetical protein [Thiomicrospira sp. XS5]|uniref:hypothetical protein n=1 Tax=Thiomicrospira sp. XS5 TaxID=1775636 RepID=UPI001F24F8B4|nr:hypothetical protein [Thiomicrospira sp. XS5]